MVIASCVSPSKLVRVEAAAEGTHQVLIALDWGHVESMIRRKPVDLLIVDPQFTGIGPPQTEPIRALRHRFRSLPMIVYANLAAQTLQPLMELAAEGIDQLVLYGFDDDPRRLRALFERQPGIALSERLIGALHGSLRYAPAPVAYTIQRLIRNPASMTIVEEFVAAAGVPRRSVYRHLERAGLASPHDLIVGARVLRAYAFLREPAYSIGSVALHVHFANADSLTSAMKRMVGVTPARARGRMPPEDFVDRLARALTQPQIESA